MWRLFAGSFGGVGVGFVPPLAAASAGTIEFALSLPPTGVGWDVPTCMCTGKGTSFAEYTCVYELARHIPDRLCGIDTTLAVPPPRSSGETATTQCW